MRDAIREDLAGSLKVEEEKIEESDLLLSPRTCATHWRGWVVSPYSPCSQNMSLVQLQLKVELFNLGSTSSFCWFMKSLL